MKDQPKSGEKRLTINAGADNRPIAVRMRPGAGPALMWVGGFRSTMNGVKASALDHHCAEREQAFLRFDYSGMGESGGDFMDATISRWFEEARAVAQLADGPMVLVGSSMGGWISLLLAEELAKAGKPLKALILIAPAADMTRRLIETKLDDAAHAALTEHGHIMVPSAYGDGPYPITAKLIEDGARHHVLERDLKLSCPVHILHGALDPDVPLNISEALLGSLALEDVTLTVIPDGDHRLSRDEDISLLLETVSRYSSPDA